MPRRCRIRHSSRCCLRGTLPPCQRLAWHLLWRGQAHCPDIVLEAQCPGVGQVWMVHHEGAVLGILVVDRLEGLARVLALGKDLRTPLFHSFHSLRTTDRGLGRTGIVQTGVFRKRQLRRILVGSYHCRLVALHIRHESKLLKESANLSRGEKEPRQLLDMLLVFLHWLLQCAHVGFLKIFHKQMSRLHNCSKLVSSGLLLQKLPKPLTNQP